MQQARQAQPLILIDNYETVLQALAAALLVVTPRGYSYREASLDDLQSAYTKIMARKSKGLFWASVLFGLGLALFAALIVVMLLARV